MKNLQSGEVVSNWGGASRACVGVAAFEGLNAVELECLARMLRAGVFDVA